MRAPHLHTIGLALAAVTAIGTTALAHVDPSACGDSDFTRTCLSAARRALRSATISAADQRRCATAPIHGTREVDDAGAAV